MDYASRGEGERYADKNTYRPPQRTARVRSEGWWRRVLRLGTHPRLKDLRVGVTWTAQHRCFWGLVRSMPRRRRSVLEQSGQCG